MKQQRARILQVEVVKMQQNILSKVTFLKKIYYRFLLFIISYRNQSKILISLSLECMIRWKYLNECTPENVSDYFELLRFEEIIDDVTWKRENRVNWQKFWKDWFEEIDEEVRRRIAIENTGFDNYDDYMNHCRAQTRVRLLTVCVTIVVVWFCCNDISGIIQAMDGFTIIAPIQLVPLEVELVRELLQQLPVPPVPPLPELD
jgi:hypothetical protein